MAHALDEVAGAAPVQVGVTSSSTTVLTANYDRYGLIMTNMSDGTMYLAFGANAAVVGSGIPVLPGGGNFSMDSFSFTKGAIQAINHTGTGLLAIQEFVQLR